MESDERPRQLKGCVIRVSWTQQLATQYSRRERQERLWPFAARANGLLL